MTERKPRVLLYDLETSPLVGYAWRPYKTNLIKVRDDFRILSVAWKWLGEKRIYDASIPEWTDDMTDDYGVVATIADQFDEADIVVAHNGQNFDQRKLRARMFLLGMDPCKPVKEVDTLQTCRRTFALTSNRLDKVCEQLGIGTKGHTGGFDTWEDCMSGDPAAWRRMVRYSRQDIRLLEALYLRLQAWDAYAPNMSLIMDRPDACPKCGATENAKGRPALVVNGGADRADTRRPGGFRYAGVTKRRSFRCTVCHGYCSGRAIIKSDVMRVV